MKRHHVPEMASTVNENSYGYDSMYSQQQQQHTPQSRKHLEDVTNYEPQQMHNLSYGSSPSDYDQAGLMGGEMNGGGGSNWTNNNSNSEGTAKPIIISNNNLDAVS